MLEEDDVLEEDDGYQYHQQLAAASSSSDQQQQLNYTRSVSGAYVCIVCGKSFAKRAQLNRHFRSHTGEKPYKCFLCDNCYSQKCHVQRHCKKIHNLSDEEYRNLSAEFGGVTAAPPTNVW